MPTRLHARCDRASPNRSNSSALPLTDNARPTVLSSQTHLFLKEMRKTKTLEEKKKMLIERQAGGALSSTAPHAPLHSFAPHNSLWL